MLILPLDTAGRSCTSTPLAEMVVAKFSSYPTPTPAGNEFYSAFAALPALGGWLAAEGGQDSP